MIGLMLVALPGNNLILSLNFASQVKWYSRREAVSQQQPALAQIKCMRARAHMRTHTHTHTHTTSAVDQSHGNLNWSNMGRCGALRRQLGQDLRSDLWQKWQWQQQLG